MNPNAPQPSFELPAIPNGTEANPSGVHEQPASRPETFTQPAPPTPSQAGASAQYVPPVMPQQAGAVNPSATPVASVPLIADDAELIEKEWVLKAKQIVAATKEDPYTQTKEMSKFKADYLKKRYNKDVKVEES